MKLENKIAVITGGTRGIGGAVVKEFLKEGAKVVLCGSTQENADKAVAALKVQFPESVVEGYAPDLKSYESVKAVVDHTVETYGKLDILVNVAGITDFKPFEEYTTAWFKNIIDVNLVGTFNMCLAASKPMMALKSGVMINTSSTTAFVGSCGGCAYGTSKFAVEGLTYSLGRELAQYGIRVNAVMPGWIGTEMVMSVPKEIIEPSLSRTPLQRMGTVEECAKPYVFLASDEASYCTTTILECDGATRFTVG